MANVVAVMGLTPCMLCVQICRILCVLDYYLLNSQLWMGQAYVLESSRLESLFYFQITSWLRISWNKTYRDYSNNFDWGWNGSGRLGLLIIFCEYSKNLWTRTSTCKNLQPKIWTCQQFLSDILPELVESGCPHKFMHISTCSLPNMIIYLPDQLKSKQG